MTTRWPANWSEWLKPYTFGERPMEELIKDANSRGWYVAHISQDLDGKWNCQLWAPDQSVDMYRRKITPHVTCNSLQEAVEESILKIPQSHAPHYPVHQGNLGQQPAKGLADLLGLVMPAQTKTFRRV